MNQHRTGGFATRLIVAALAGAMTWTAIHAWNGMVERPLEFTGPALTAAALIAVTGAALRGLRPPAYVVLLLQVVVVLIWFYHHQDVTDAYGGWLPTWDGITAISDQIRTGASAVNTYVAPVRAARVTAPMYLLALALVVLLAVDFIAAGLRRPTWAGLPILVSLTVPISVLTEGLSAPVFIGTAVLFVALLAAVENEQTLAWGQAVTGRRQRNDGTDQILDGASAQVPAMKIGVVAAVGALVLPIFIPLGHNLLDLGSGSNSGTRGAGEPLHLHNPMADLRRDLVRQDHLALLTVQTGSTDRAYLRTTVLDSFNGNAWVPGKRKLPATNTADGQMPDPFNIVAVTNGTTSTWELRTTSNFLTSWLPTPYLTRTIAVDQGDWRYDVSTLDLVSTDNDPPAPVSYRLTQFAPTFDPAKMASAPPPPDDIGTSMTQVPKLSATITRIAEQVTSGVSTPYAKVALLQRWFRTDGGFRYSLEPAPGNGMAQLERFITTDRVGYCEQFAAAMAVMARALHIPARVVVGFLDGEQTGKNQYTYTSDDLHAWPEIFFRGSGWVRFEPTPSARTGTAPAWTSGNVQAPTPATPSASPSPTTAGPTPGKKPTEADTSSNDGGASRVTDLRFLVVLLLLVALTVPTLVRRTQRRRRLGSQSDPRAEVENLWREIRATAIDVRIPWPEGRSPRTAARIICHRVNAGPDESAALVDLVGVVEEARYRASFDLDEETRERARQTVRTWITVLVDAAPPRRARMARFLPRSVLDPARRTDVPAAQTQADPNSFTEVG